MGRLLTRYSPVRHSLKPEGLSSFDLHVLSMPPAFILSQNQTLKFNCLKSLLLLKATTALTLLSLCWLCFKVLAFLQVLEINGNYLSICIVSNKISFLSYSIFNLLFPELQLGASASRRELVYNTITIFLCQLFFRTFLTFFKKIFLSSKIVKYSCWQW